MDAENIYAVPDWSNFLARENNQIREWDIR